MCTLFRHSALMKDYNFIAMPDGLDAMGNNDDRFLPVLKPIQCFPDFGFRYRVKGRSSLIQDQDFRIAIKCPRDGNALALAAA